ncbi:MAG: diguanylate cyclase [Burkholderiales bacterium]
MLPDLALPACTTPPEDCSILAQAPDACPCRPMLGALRGLLDDVQQRAANDPLTGLATKPVFEDAAERALDEQRRYGHPVSLVFCDIDRFKSINDTHGHSVGDVVLREVAQRVRRTLRTVDLAARYGGEEFVLLLPNTGISGARRIAERIRAALAASVIAPAGEVTASFGVAQAAPDEDLAGWLNRADAAMYAAKRSGRNKVLPALPPAGVPGAEPIGPTFLRLVWCSDYESGDACIDAEHERLFTTANEVLAAALDGNNARLLPPLDLLIEQCRIHFADEENILARLQFPELSRHAKVHAALLHRATVLREAFANGTGDAFALVNFLARDVVALHILREDRRYFEHLPAADAS